MELVKYYINNLAQELSFLDNPRGFSVVFLESSEPARDFSPARFGPVPFPERG